MCEDCRSDKPGDAAQLADSDCQIIKRLIEALYGIAKCLIEPARYSLLLMYGIPTYTLCQLV